MLALKELEPAFSEPPGDDVYAALALEAPFTRIPVGMQPGRVAFLDHVAVGEQSNAGPFAISWKDIPADHSWIACGLGCIKDKHK